MSHGRVHRAAAIVVVAPGQRTSSRLTSTCARARGSVRNSYHSSVRVQLAGRPLVAAEDWSSTVTVLLGVPGSWRLKRAPTSRSYQGHFPRVSDAAWTPT